MRADILAAALLMWTAPAGAGTADIMDIAVQLGSVLAAEEPCGLSYDQAAIERFIEQKVPASDMSFPSTLSMTTQGSAYQMKGMSRSALTAQCAQVKRIARAYGFL